MVQVSDTVKSIWIHGCEVCEEISEKGFRVIRRMLQRKCDTLRIHGNFPFISLSDVETLIQATINCTYYEINMICRNLAIPRRNIDCLRV